MKRGKERILVLIPDDRGRREVCEALTAAGYACECYDDPLRALERLGAGDVALLVTETDLPHLTGARVLDAARSRGEALPAILIGPAPADRAPFAAEHLDRPADPGRLVAAVGRALGA